MARWDVIAVDPAKLPIRTSGRASESVAVVISGQELEKLKHVWLCAVAPGPAPSGLRMPGEIVLSEPQALDLTKGARIVAGWLFFCPNENIAEARKLGSLGRKDRRALEREIRRLLN